jgi:endo-1,4-beta-xylanase
MMIIKKTVQEIGCGTYGGAILSPDTADIGGEKSRFPNQEFFDANSPWGIIQRNAEQIREHLRVRLVCGDADEKWFPGNVKLKERAESLKIPVSWAVVAGVGHDTKGLYAKVGLESLRFLEAGFREPATAAEGRIQDIWYFSRLNQRNVWIKVYTPPGYDGGEQRYPVVYNLHGAGGGTPQRQWVRAGQTIKSAIENGKVRPLIYVFVNGLGDSFFLDYHDGSVKAESMIIRELIPFIDQRYRTISSREGRAIDGFSMGGAGALRLAVKYPELFSAVVSYGAALIRSDRLKEGDARFGTKECFDRNSAWTLVEQNAHRLRGYLRIRMVCGDQDRLYPANVEFKDLLDKLDISVDWVSVPGVAHDTTGLYRKVGLESLKFIERGLTPK